MVFHEEDWDKTYETDPTVRSRTEMEISHYL